MVESTRFLAAVEGEVEPGLFELELRVAWFQLHGLVAEETSVESNGLIELVGVESNVNLL